MSDETASNEQHSEAMAQINPAELKIALERLRSEQNLPFGLVAGVVAAALGAVIWAAVTVLTGYQIGWMAVGVGFAVGFAMRIAGKGIDKIFGIVGAALALFGCAAGNVLAVCALIAKHENMAFTEVISRLDVGVIERLMEATFNPMDLLFYGIAIYEGYKLSFRLVTQQQLRSLPAGSQ